MYFNLSQEQYEALIALAYEGVKNDAGQVVDQTKALQLDVFLRSIEASNGVTRSVVWVQWQEMDAPLPPGTDFPRVWPPELRQKIDLISRPVSRSDVDDLLAARATNPTSVLVTRDPAGILGYTELDNFFLV